MMKIKYKTNHNRYSDQIVSLSGKHGAFYLGDNKCRFSVWAPFLKSVDIHLLTPKDRTEPLIPNQDGYFEKTIDQVRPGETYRLRLDGNKERPDPASRFQPGSVHDVSQVVDPQFEWSDESWRNLPLEDYIIYELHVGTFTKEGTFEAVISQLNYLKQLGVTAIELMPVAQFPGSRNWGYDGVLPFAAQNTYGGPNGLKKLINACHENELAVIMDVVYNHLGPEGNYLSEFGPYFTDRYRTPWGQALNFDGPDSDPVRRFFIENALMWVSDFRVDALRLDAIHAICDSSAYPFLLELKDSIHQEATKQNRPLYLMPESDLNDSRIVRPKIQGGFDHDAQWMDDYHHSIHTLLTGEKKGYYADFGSIKQLETSLKEGFVYSGQYSTHRRKTHGNKSSDLNPSKFIVFSQNHDQVGNRMKGDRLSENISFEKQKLAAGLVLLSPYIPLLFMGEEYGETSPFLYFISHGDKNLVEAVRQGRIKEFSSFGWKGDIPDPQSIETYSNCKLDEKLKDKKPHSDLLKLYSSLIQLRKDEPALRTLTRINFKAGVVDGSNVIWTSRSVRQNDVVTVFNFENKKAEPEIRLPRGRWMKILDSSDLIWNGPGSLVQTELLSDGKLRLSVNGESLVVLKKKEK